MNCAMKLILASKNRHKAGEIQAILGDGFEIVTQTDAGYGEIDVVEDGETFEENAVKKAVTLMRASGKATMADDSGLCVDALGGRPGIYTARFAGEDATDDENIEKLLAELSDVTADKRYAKFVCVIAVAYPDGKVKTFRGECAGEILFERRGKGGFGYDPVFSPEKYIEAMAELPPHIKNAISHRSRALKKMKDELGLCEGF